MALYLVKPVHSQSLFRFYFQETINQILRLGGYLLPLPVPVLLCFQAEVGKLSRDNRVPVKGRAVENQLMEENSQSPKVNGLCVP